MFDRFLVKEDSLENVEKDGQIIGFKFQIRIAEYRGCFLSLHNGYYINVDGVEYPREVQKFEINGREPRDFEEIKKAYFEHWDYDDFGMVHVECPGGLSKGKHRVGVMQSVLTQYGWMPHDEEWIRNPPVPGVDAGGKQNDIYYFDMEIR